MSDMGEVVIDKCTCGEVIHVELGRFDDGACRKDGKRPFYPDRLLPDGLDPEKYDLNNVTVFRCRNCHGWVGDTVPSAKFE